MTGLQRFWRNIRNKLFSKPLVQYREVEDYKCKFCQKAFWHSLYKDICQNCVKKGIEYAIKESEKNRG